MQELKLLDLGGSEFKKYEGYIGIDITKRYSAEKQKEYTASDIRYSELARVSRPVYLNNQDPTPLFVLFHLGGGFIGGEDYKTDIIVRENTHGIFTSQSASKVYVVRKAGEPSRYFINIDLKDNAFMEYVNDSLILYPQAEYHQFNEFRLKSTSSLFYSEVFSPGYGVGGAKYQYTEMWLKSKIYIDDKLVLFDNLNFQPKLESPEAFGTLDGFDRCGTAFYISPKITESLADEIRHLITSAKFDFKFEFGISNFIEHGLGLRVLANEFFEVQMIISMVHNYLREHLFGLEPLNLRKK